MNKEKFMRTLEIYLEDFSEKDRAEMLYDYEEHFRIGLESGKTEEELIKELGDPFDIAIQYRKNCGYEKIVVSGDTTQVDTFKETNNKDYLPVQYSQPQNNERYTSSNNYGSSYNQKSAASSALAAVALIIFNLIFVVWIFIGLAGGLIGLFGGAVGAFFGGIGLTFGTILQPLLGNFVHIPMGMPTIANTLFGIGTIAFGTLFFIADCYLAKYFIKGTMKYINWNLSIIRR